MFPVLDLAFVCQVRSLETLTASEDEVDGHVFIRLDAINPDEIAFPSVRHALERFRQRPA